MEPSLTSIHDRFTRTKRKEHSWRCTLCNKQLPSETSLRKHLEEHRVVSVTEIERLLHEGRPRVGGPPASAKPPTSAPRSPKRPAEATRNGVSMEPGRRATQDDSAASAVANDGTDDNEIDNGSRNKRLKSPDSGQVFLSNPGSPQVPTPPVPDSQLDVVSGTERNLQNRSIWQSGDPGLPRRTAERHYIASSRHRLTQGNLQARAANPGANSRNTAPPPGDQEEDESSVFMIRQPETRPIAQDQLVNEVKGIYAGLVMVESKCIEVDNQQNQLNNTEGAELTNEQWQALIALHRTLLHEHHDFFLASQHPSASAALRRLASKYAMPARMWRHGIHSFLELLRCRLPESIDHMLTFIYLAYNMMALLHDTVPAFADTWIECLGDLSRYRMAIEEQNHRDRETWTVVSRHWYGVASDRNPTTGRLYHHLAILARPAIVTQLFYYVKSLCVENAFISARESIMTLFEPVFKGAPTQAQAIEISFVKTHGILFTRKPMADLDLVRADFLNQLDLHIHQAPKEWMVTGQSIAVVNCGALMEYGIESNCLVQALKGKKAEDVSMHGFSSETPSSETFRVAQELAIGTDEIVLGRTGDTNTFPYIHVRLLWLRSLASHQVAASVIDCFPWEKLLRSLNLFMRNYSSYERIESDDFPTPEKEQDFRPLPEDWQLRGLLFASDYYPANFFSSDKLDDQEKTFETASMTDERRERILWLACRLATHKQWITYENHQFAIVGTQGQSATTGSITSDPDTGGATDLSEVTPGQEDVDDASMTSASLIEARDS